MRNILIIILANLLVLSAKGEVVIKGLVTDPLENVLEGAAVVWLDASDGHIVSSAVTDEKGKFTLSSSEKVSNSKITVSLFGYYDAVVIPDSEVVSVTLTPKESELRELVVSAKALPLKLGVCGFEFDPESLRGIAKNAYGMITYVPFVTTEGVNNFKILDRPMTILINGKKPRIDQSSVVEYLKTVNPDYVKKINIITYKDLSTGSETALDFIIDNPYEGFYGNLGGSVDYGSMNDVSGTGNFFLAYNRGPFSISGSLYTYQNSNKSRYESIYSFKDTGVEYSEDGDNDSYSQTYGGSVNVSHEINKNSRLGLSTELKLLKSNGTNTNRKFFFSPNDKTEETVYSQSIPHFSPRTNATIYYELTTDEKKSNLDVSFGIWYGKASGNNTVATSYLAGSDNEAQVKGQDIWNMGHGQNISVKYQHNFDNKSRLNVGAEYSGMYKNLDSSRDGAEKEHFKYSEQVVSSYLQYFRSLSNNLNFSIGSRFEETFVDSRYKEDTSFSYFTFIPEMNLSMFFKNGFHLINLQLSTSVERPNGDELNPFETWNNSNVYYVGDFTSKANVSYILRILYRLANDYSIDFSYMPKHVIKGVLMTPEKDDVIRCDIGNVAKTSAYTVSLYWERFFFGRIWRPQVSVFCGYNVRKGMAENPSLDKNYFTTDIRFYNNFIFSQKKDFRGGIQWQYMPIFYQTNGDTKGINSLFVFLSKGWGIGNDYLDCVLSFMGNLGNKTRRFDTQTLYVYNKISNPFQIGLQLSYTFGKENIQRPSNRNDKSGLNKAGL